MDSRHKLIAGSMALGLALSAAVARADPLSFYLGGDFVRLETKVDDQTGVPPIVTGTAKASTLRLKGGAHLLPWLDAELQWVIPNEETYSQAGATNTVKTSVWALFAKPHADFGQASVYGLFGFANSSHDFSGVIEGNKSVSDFAYGVGVAYNFTRNVAGTIDWTQYTKKNVAVDGFSGGLDLRTSAFGAGIRYTF